MNSREFVEMYDNDSRGFTNFYRRYKVKFTSFLGNKYKGLDVLELDDIYHHSIIDLVRQIKLKPEYEIESIEGYLSRIGNFKAIKRCEKQKLYVDIDQIDDIADAQDEDLLTDEKNILKSIVSDIEPECIKMLNQLYVNCKKLVEIAQNLKITAATARKRKSRCLENIRKIYMPKFNALNGNYGI